MRSDVRARPGADRALLFASRGLRLFAFGALSIAFVSYLAAAGFSGRAIAALLTATLLGDAAVSLWITTNADRRGRRAMLCVGALLTVAGGAAFLLTRRIEWLMIGATLGVLSPSGNEAGPFLPIEQAALSQLGEASDRTRTFAWYSLTGSVATALGALAGGTLVQAALHSGAGEAASWRLPFVVHTIAGALLLALAAALSPAVEAPATEGPAPRAGVLGLHRSAGVVGRLSGLFALDAFAGGFVIQSVLVHWFHARWGANPATIGALFFGANLLSAASALLAHRIAARVGLLRTMVFTHLPSNVLLLLVPVMPSLGAAIGVLLARFSISQMDVPTRQSYTMAVVEPDERAAAAGVTGIARSLGAALAPAVAGPLLLASGGAPFWIAGGLKIAYDLLLWRAFRSDAATRAIR